MIAFDPVKHTYTNTDTNKVYLSVTKLLGKFKPIFEQEKMAQIVAYRRKISVEEVLAEWEKTKNDACDYGTNFHAILEEFNKEGTFEPENEAIIKEFQKTGSYKVSEGTLIEHCVYNHEFQVAGTADIIRPYGEYFDVVDFKTNKNFTFQSKYDKFLLGPVSHLTECDYSIYALQLSMYAYFYERLTGRKARSLYILYFNREKVTFEKYIIPYLVNDIKNILISYASTPLITNKTYGL